MSRGSGVLYQLASKGVEDNHLYSFSNIVPFKAIYKKHTSFSIMQHMIPFNSNINFGSNCSVNIPRLGDLIGNKLYINLQIPKITIAYKNTIQEEKNQIKNSDGTNVEIIIDGEKYKNNLLDIIDFLNIVTNNTDISKLRNRFETNDLYNNFMLYELNTSNKLTLNFNDKLYYSNSIINFEYSFHKLNTLVSNNLLTSYSIYDNINNDLKDSLLFLPNSNNKLNISDINSELDIYHEYYYKISQNSNYNENSYASSIFTVNLNDQLILTETYKLYSLSNSSKLLLGDIYDFTVSTVTLRLTNKIYSLSDYVILFLCNNKLNFTTTATLIVNDILKNGDFEIKILNINGSEITFELIKTPLINSTIPTNFLTTNNVTVNVTNFNGKFSNINSFSKINSNIENDVLLFFTNLSSSDYNSLFIENMEYSLSLPLWYLYQFYNVINKSTNGTNDTFNMITRKINIDRTTYDLDITTNTIIQNDTQYSYFSKNYNRLYLQATGYNFTILNLENISTKLTEQITSNLNSYKNTTKNNFSDNLSNHFLTNTGNSSKPLFKSILIYSNINYIEKIIYDVDITGKTFVVATDVIVHNKDNDSVVFTGAQISNIIITDSGTSSTNIKITFDIQKIILFLFGKNYHAQLLTDAEINKINIINNATHYSFLPIGSSSYVKCDITSKVQLLDNSIDVSSTIADITLYDKANKYYISNFMLADYLQYMHNIFKTKFFHKIDYALEQKIESTMVKLYIKIRNKYFHSYENMPSITTIGQLYLTQITNYDTLYDPQNLLNESIGTYDLTEIQIKNILDSTTISNTDYNYARGKKINDINLNNLALTYPTIFIIHDSGADLPNITKQQYENAGYYVFDSTATRVYSYSKNTPGLTITINSNTLDINGFTTQYKGEDYNINDKLRFGNATDYIQYKVATTKNYVFLEDVSTGTSNISDFRFILSDSVTVASSPLTYIENIGAYGKTISLYSIDNLTFTNNNFEVNNLNDIKDIISNKITFSGFIADNSTNANISNMMLDAINTITLVQNDLDVANGYHPIIPADNLNLLTKSQSLSILETYLNSFKTNYTYYYAIKNLEKENSSYISFLQSFIDSFSSIGQLMYMNNKIVEEGLDFNLSDYNTNFSKKLYNYDFSTNTSLISNTLALYKNATDKFSSYKLNYDEENTIFNFKNVLIDNTNYSNSNLKLYFDSLLFNGNKVKDTYYSTNNNLLKNTYNKYFLDNRKFILDNVNFIKNIITKKYTYDFVFLFSIYGYLSNSGLESLIDEISINLGNNVDLVSEENETSSYFNTLFADKKVYQYKKTLMTYDEYVQSKIAFEEQSTNGTALVREVFIRDKYKTLPNICIDTIRDSVALFNEDIYLKLQQNFERMDSSTIYINNITTNNAGGFTTIHRKFLPSFSGSHIKLYLDDTIYTNEIILTGDSYVTTIDYNVNNQISVAYGYHILKKIIVTTEELHKLETIDTINKVNDLYERKYQLPPSITLINNGSLSLKRNFDKDKFLKLNKFFEIVVTNIKKDNSTTIETEFTFDSTTMSLNTTDLVNDFIMIFGDKMSAYGYYDTQLRLQKLNRSEFKRLYKCSVYKLGLNNHDIGYSRFFSDSLLLSDINTPKVHDIIYNNLATNIGYTYSIDTTKTNIDSVSLHYVYNLTLNNNDNISMNDSLVLSNGSQRRGVKQIISISDKNINLALDSQILAPTKLFNYSYVALNKGVNTINEILKDDSIIIGTNTHTVMENEDSIIIKKLYDGTAQYSIQLKDWYSSNIKSYTGNNIPLFADDNIVYTRKKDDSILFNLDNNSINKVKFGIKRLFNTNIITDLTFDPTKLLELFYDNKILKEKLDLETSNIFESTFGNYSFTYDEFIKTYREKFLDSIKNIDEKDWYYDKHDIDYKFGLTDNTIKNDNIKNLITNNFNKLQNYRDYKKKIEILDERNNVPKFKFIENFGINLLEKVQLILGETVISEYDSDYLYIAEKLLGDFQDGYKKMIGNDVNDYIQSNYKSLYIPIWWMFDRIPFPLISSIHTDMSIRVKLRNMEDILLTTDSNIKYTIDKTLKGNLLANYFYLDHEERKKFAENRHEYLVEQVNRMVVPQPNFNFDVNNLITIPVEFGNPTKDIIFFFKTKSNKNNKLLNRYGVKIGAHESVSWTQVNNVFVKKIKVTDILANPVDKAKIKFNGKDRITYLDGKYFNCYIPAKYYKNSVDTGVNVYTFALNPTAYEPSGSLNMSYVEDFNLFMKMNVSEHGDVHVYTRNYNILRIMGGQAGLLYLK